MSRRTMADRKRRAADRKTRRESLLVTLARLDRGVITNAERPLLREAVEAEIIESDDLRSTIDGLQRALQAALRRAEAAEEAIVEAEQDRDEVARRLRGYVAIFGPDVVEDFHAMQHRAKTAEQRLTRIRLMADGWERRLPDVIRTATAAEAVRLAADGDYRPVMFGVRQAAPPCPTPETHNWGCGCPTDHSAHIQRAQAAEQRAEEAEAILGRAHRALAAILAKPGETPLDELTEYAAKTLTRSGQRIIDAEQAARTAIENHQEAERQLAELRQEHAAEWERMRQVDEKADRELSELADAARKFKAWGEEQHARAERVEAELAAARTHAAEQGKTIARLLREVGDAEQQAADMRKAYTDADALATLRGVQRDAARDTLRATENDLADARRRLAERSGPCPGPAAAEPNHPLFPLYRALTIGEPLDDDRANELIRAYYTAIHDAFCTRSHPETP